MQVFGSMVVIVDHDTVTVGTGTACCVVKLAFSVSHFSPIITHPKISTPSVVMVRVGMRREDLIIWIIVKIIMN